MRFYFGGTYDDWLDLPYLAWGHHLKELPKLVDNEHAQAEAAAVNASMLPWIDKSARASALRRLRARFPVQEAPKGKHGSDRAAVATLPGFAFKTGSD